MRPWPPGLGTKKPGLHHLVGLETAAITFFSRSISVTFKDSDSYALGTARAVAMFSGFTSEFGLMEMIIGESVIIGLSGKVSLSTLGNDFIRSLVH